MYLLKHLSFYYHGENILVFMLYDILSSFVVLMLYDILSSFVVLMLYDILSSFVVTILYWNTRTISLFNYNFIHISPSPCFPQSLITTTILSTTVRSTFLDSTFEWDHMVHLSFYSWITSLNIMISSSSHIVANYRI
jgi:hypothetical protein